MKNIKVILLLLLLYDPIFPQVTETKGNLPRINSAKSQFKKSLLVNMPGKNIEIDLVSYNYFPAKTFIAWINILDSVYTVYLKQLSPIIGENVVVASDKTMKTRLQIQTINYHDTLRVVWQSEQKGNWQVVERKYFEGNFSDTSVLLDSLKQNPQISLSSSSIAWISDGILFIKEFDKYGAKIYKPDSNYCSNPNIRGNILYEKEDTDGKNIYIADYNRYPSEHWGIEKVSTGGINANPSSGFEGGGFVYESLINQKWKILYGYMAGYSDTTKNLTYNCNNPEFFTYPIATSQQTEKTLFFIVFESDSIEGNKEIMIQNVYYGSEDTLINVSQTNGDDSNPHLAYLTNNDTVFISIVWEHSTEDISEIWIAKSIYDPVIGAVDDKSVINYSVELNQNYPNPFNPSTTISYEIPAASQVELKIYDVLGREVSTIVDEYQNAGTYNAIFNTQQTTNNRQLTSGIYFYKLKANNYLEVKKMLLLK